MEGIIEIFLKNISLFVCQRSNNCPKQHGRAKTSNKQMSNLTFTKAILTVEVINIRTLEPTPSFGHVKCDKSVRKLFKRKSLFITN